MGTEQKKASSQRRSSMDLINMSNDFRNAIANLSSSRSTRTSAATPKMGEQMGDNKGRMSELHLPLTIGRQRSASIDISVLPVVRARRQSMDLRVDQDYIELQKKKNIDERKVSNSGARGRRASVDVGLQSMTNASILTAQKKLTALINSQSLIGDDVEPDFPVNRRRSSVGNALMVPRHTNERRNSALIEAVDDPSLICDQPNFSVNRRRSSVVNALMVPRHTTERRNSAPIEAVDDPSLTCDPHIKYKRHSCDSATSTNENNSSKFPTKWFEFKDRIQREKFAAVRARSASPTLSDPRSSKSSDSYRTEQRLIVVASQTEDSVAKSTYESPDFAGPIRLLVTPPSPDLQRTHRHKVNNDVEHTKTEISDAKQFSVQNMPSDFAGNRRRGSVDIIISAVDPQKAQRKDARLEHASKQCGGKHTRDRHTKKTMYGSQIKQYLKSLEKICLHISCWK